MYPQMLKKISFLYGATILLTGYNIANIKSTMTSNTKTYHLRKEDWKGPFPPFYK